MSIWNKHLWARYKPYVIVLGICAWGGMLFIALKTNPSTSEAHAKLVMMKSDMDALMAQGGKVIAIDENAKYGGAIVLRTLHDEGWSNALVQRYEEILIAKDWEKVPSSLHSFCKDGALTKITSNSGMQDGHGTHSVSMVFNPTTIKKCSEMK